MDPEEVIPGYDAQIQSAGERSSTEGDGTLKPTGAGDFGVAEEFSGRAFVFDLFDDVEFALILVLITHVERDCQEENGLGKAKIAILVPSGLRYEKSEGTLRLLSDSSTAPGLAQDLQVFMKVRLNVFVLITTLFGFFLAAKGLEGGMSTRWILLLHTLIGTAAAAFGSAAFNQLMEIEDDARMERTADRPLPSRRLGVVKGFVIGWGLGSIASVSVISSVLAVERNSRKD